VDGNEFAFTFVDLVDSGIIGVGDVVAGIGRFYEITPRYN